MVSAAPRGPRRNIFRRMAASRLFWDHVMGPSYNRSVLGIKRSIYPLFMDSLAERGAVHAHAHILDIGSGPGLLAVMLAEEYPDAVVVGVDFSPRQVHTANRLLSRSRPGNCRFEVGDAADLPFEEGWFDLVVSTFSISSWSDMLKGLGEARRVLAEGGRAFIVDADSSSPQDEIRRFTASYASAGANRRLNEWVTRRLVFGPAIAITCREAAALAAGAGYSSVDAKKIPGLPLFQLDLRR